MPVNNNHLIIYIIVFALHACAGRNGTEQVVFSMENQTIYATDTLFIYHTEIIPVADGIANDKAWEKATWYPINQVWIPYGATIDSTVFYGRYKMVWSSQTNLLYILAEITDNVFVGGYEYHPDPSQGQGYANYDILEVFIDENKSCELHVFNATGEDALLWGSNAEAAFACHIAIETPTDGQVITRKNALDITGTGWSDYTIADYQDHLPDFAVKRKGDYYTWEFSLKVYGDTYDHNQPELSRIQLHEGKVMGFSVAYCNNDNADEEPKRRDHFFGSVWVPMDNYNDHWKDSSYFGTLVLMK